LALPARPTRYDAPPQEARTAVHVLCLDLEGVLVPEIWIGVAERTGIEELRLTTRDEPDYDKLMRRRLAILARKGLGLPDVEAVIGAMDPLPGAAEFLAWARERFQVLILSDTFYEFARPLMRKLGWPTLFCNSLVIGDDGRIEDYRLRQPDGKRCAVQALHGLGFRVLASGDSYNDTSMLAEAEAGVLFRPPERVAREFPHFPVAGDYDALRAALERAARGVDG
jgi:phosphoserine/homoserine phosphotransferase